MQVVKFPQTLPKGKKTLVLGAFNGFHNGHVKLIEEAKKLGKPVVVMIIEGISKLPNKEKEYTSLEVRLQQFANYGVEYAIVVDFDSVALKPGKEFLDEITKATGAVHYVGGKDFAMGKGRDLKIKDIPNSIIVPPVRVSDRKISTSVLKDLVEVGDVKLIRSLAPYYYQMKVHVDAKNNATQDIQELPHTGVYAVFVNFNDVQYPATLHIDRDKTMKLKVPDFKAKNVNYDPIISFVKMIRKIYKASHDEVTKDDELAVNQALLRAEEYIR